MAIPTVTSARTTFFAATAENRRPDLVDNFYGSAPFWIQLKSKNKITTKGGRYISAAHIYANFPASSYGRGDEFDTTVREFATDMQFDWGFSYSPCNLDVIDIDLNDSPEQTFDLVEAAMENAELSLINDLATQLVADGTGNAGKDMKGLAIAVSQSGTYGGITRGTDTVGTSIKCAAEDTTGGATSLALINTNFGLATVGNKSPYLLLTTQVIYNRIWERSQPSERSTPSDKREIGYNFVRINGAAVAVESHLSTGLLYGLNSEFWDLYAHAKWDFRFRGYAEPVQQQNAIGQLIFWGQSICRGPRFQFAMSGLT